MRNDCRYYVCDITLKKKTGCKCNNSYKEQNIKGCKCSLFGKVKETICDKCKRYKK
jgi:hypothetical protein